MLFLDELSMDHKPICPHVVKGNGCLTLYVDMLIQRDCIVYLCASFRETVAASCLRNERL